MGSARAAQMPCAGVADRPGSQPEAARSRSGARAAGYRLRRCDILLQRGPTGSARSRPAGVTYPPARRRDLGADRHAGRDRGGRGAGTVRVRAGHRDRQPGQVGRCGRSSPGAAGPCAHAAHLGGTGAARIGRHGDDGPAYRRAAGFWLGPGWGNGGQCRAPVPDQGAGPAGRAGGRGAREGARGPAARHPRGYQPGHAPGHHGTRPAGPPGAAGARREQRLPPRPRSPPRGWPGPR